MKTVQQFCLLICFLVLFTYRLPAPIVEENPTPTRERAVKPKPKRTAESKSVSNPRPTATPVTMSAKKFAGTWSGLIDNNSWAWGGQHQMQFIVNPTETRVNVEPQAGNGVAQVNGNTISWKSTWYWNPWHWTMAVNPDGRTAHVSATFADGGSASGFVTKVN